VSRVGYEDQAIVYLRLIDELQPISRSRDHMMRPARIRVSLLPDGAAL
jgi:hypothetical protein